MTKVLIADDAETMLTLLKFVFKKEGYEVIEASDGKKALELFVQESPNIVVSDCLLPKMDGFKLVKEIREREEKREAIVILISAIYKKSNYRRAALEAGADMFMNKPFEPEELISAVRKLEA